MDIAIQTERLGKRYRIGAAGRPAATLRDAIASGLSRIADSGRRRRAAPGHDVEAPHREIWALKDASFQVERGEVLGVVGRNGAGKSTLLKILSRITEPTEGRARIRGRVASLLEVGVGFHPELTGRENIFVNGAILGLSRAEITARFDEIVSFAEVDAFIDTPVKHYSTGMQVRLAFAVAAHLEPEVLLIDEVLAVGDAGFQKKCLGRMQEVGRSGRTVLFVSHNLAAVVGLCRRAILIDGGRIAMTGSAHEVVERHLASFGGAEGSTIADRTDRYGDGRLRVTSAWLADAAGKRIDFLQAGRPGQIVLKYVTSAPAPLRNVLVNIYLTTMWGERLCDFQTNLVGDNFADIPAAGEFVCAIPRVPLQPGRYHFTFRIYSSERLTLDIVENAGTIQVESGDYFGRGRLPEAGTVFVEHTWQCRPSVPARPDAQDAAAAGTITSYI